MSHYSLIKKLTIGFVFFLPVSLFAGNLAETLPDFTELVDANAAAVVNISTTTLEKVQEGGLPPNLEIPDIPDIPEDSPLGDLLKKFFGEQQGRGGMEPFNSRSLGSGFIISNDGYVITNYHVVNGADEVIVKLSDKRQLVAEVIGADARSDIALLKIDAKELPVLELGLSSDLKAGQWVLAIGSPFGFDHSVTAGIVSATERSLPSENYVPFIQTDVAINPGNSGGPLFNMEGKVVGINSQIYSRTGGYMGVSFAIPIEVAMDVVEQLKTTGHVSRGWLGVYIQEVTRELAESFGMENPTGALVARVLPDSPALKAGIAVGDIILSFNGKEITGSSTLPPMVGLVRAGEEVEMEIMRNGAVETRTVRIGELPEEDPMVLSDKPPGPNSKNVVLGLEVQELSDEQRAEMEIEKGGVLVLSVEEGAGKNAGIRQGDVIQMINNEPVTTIDELKAIIEKLPKDKYASVLVLRLNGPEFLALKISE